MKATARLRELMRAPDLIVAPGCYDGLTGQLIEQAGYSVAYMTGAGTSMSRGFPDYGLLTMDEMVGNAGVIARSVTIPLIADSDTGYGNELNVTRTVREFEMRGVAGIHIEDQVSPKRCGHLDGKEVISREEYVSKIRAAVAARTDPDFVIIARTDSRAVIGFEEAIVRANQALAAGADMAFVEAVQDMDELKAVPRQVKGPCLYNMVLGGKTPLIPFTDAQEIGYRLAILPGLLLRAVVRAVDETLREVKEKGQAPTTMQHSVAQGFARFGSEKWDALRKTYGK